jgi:two-component system LytT family response regulator
MTTLNTAVLPLHDMRIVVPTNDGVHFFRAADITRLEGNSNYTYIHFANRKPLLMAKVLKKYEELLAPMGFIRVHQSHIVNKQYISCIDADGRVVLTDDSAVMISRRKRKEVFSALMN